MFHDMTVCADVFCYKKLKKTEKSFREAILFLQFSTYPFFCKSIKYSQIRFLSFWVYVCSHRILTQIIVQYKLWIYLKVVFFIWNLHEVTEIFIIEKVWMQDYFPVLIEHWRVIKPPKLPYSTPLCSENALTKNTMSCLYDYILNSFPYPSRDQGLKSCIMKPSNKLKYKHKF